MKNFGTIKSVVNSIISESISNKSVKGRKLFKEYINKIKKNEILKTQFHIYSNIESKYEINESRAIEFVKANISLMDKFSKSDIEKANKDLSNIFFKEVLGSSSIYSDNEKLNYLHEDISKLILLNKNHKNISESVDRLTSVAEFIMNNKPTNNVINENLGVSNEILTPLVVDGFNNQYNELNENQRELVNLVVESKVSDRETFYNKLIKECLTKINNLLKVSDITTKESLLSAKENLLNRSFNDDNFIEESTKIIELSNDLD